MMRSTPLSLLVLLPWLLLFPGACTPSKSGSPEVGSQTNWLRRCDTSQQCGDLECLCGTCSARCVTDDACGALSGASCIAAAEPGAQALCTQDSPPAGLCLPRCDEGCPAGTVCLDGDVCAPAPTSTVVEPPPLAVDASTDSEDASVEDAATVRVDTSIAYQTLVGFGASLAYEETRITALPNREAFYDLAFADSGLDVLRLTNHYEPGGAPQVMAAGAIVAAAAQRMGGMPLVLMTSGTPPASLKANGARGCAGELQTCTLTTAAGAFDYAGFARYWRDALDAYAAAGITPDYIGIQNNPNWIPPADNPHDGCRFLPEEGTTSVDVDGGPVDIAYPGYREALAAVRAALADMAQPPHFTAPETNAISLVGDYVMPLDVSTFDALAIHLYEWELVGLDLDALAHVGELAAGIDRPVFQTEMQAEGFDTAVLVHHAMTTAGAVAYVQNDLLANRPEWASVALLQQSGGGFEPQGPYYALAHYAKYTAPGWVRFDVESGPEGLLASAWLSPDGRALTVVLVNPGEEDVQAELQVPGDVGSQLTRSERMRTQFDRAERGAMLGPLPADGMLVVPPRSVLTVALSAE